ncbi:MAG: YibE/F family protein [Patescibacteria group bacterium]|nr:YibE/F family protein [Patescibacteria group bacterium]
MTARQKIALPIILATAFFVISGKNIAAQVNEGPANQNSTVNNESSSNANDESYERAIIKNVASSEDEIPNGGQQKQRYTIEYLSGPLKGLIRTLSSDIDSNPYNIKPVQGDKVVILLQPNPEGGEQLAFLEGFDRLGAMIWLVILFIFVLVILAGWQGFKVAFSIILSVALIGWVLIPSFLKGMDPVPVAIVLSVVLTSLSCVLSMGWNKKSWITIVGTLCGVLTAYFISVAFSNWAHLGGLSTEEDRMFFGKNSALDPRGLMFAGIIIAAMGVVEDVAVSIASGVVEIRKANPKLNIKKLFHSGMVIGRDHMGAMANTLIFAYVGASLSTLLLYNQFGGSWLKFLNFDIVSDEILRSLSGTIGLVLTVPMTAILAAMACIKLPDVPVEIEQVQTETDDSQQTHY